MIILRYLILLLLFMKLAISHQEVVVRISMFTPQFSKSEFLSSTQVHVNIIIGLTLLINY